MFGHPAEALEFAEGGGTVSLTEWAALAESERVALRAAFNVLRQRHAVEIAEAIRGRLTEPQRREHVWAELEQAVHSAEQ